VVISPPPLSASQRAEVSLRPVRVGPAPDNYIYIYIYIYITVKAPCGLLPGHTDTLKNVFSASTGRRRHPGQRQSPSKPAKLTSCFFKGRDEVCAWLILITAVRWSDVFEFVVSASKRAQAEPKKPRGQIVDFLLNCGPPLPVSWMVKSASTHRSSPRY
jgi:hypothetical protein